MQEREDRQQGLYRSEYEHDACGVGLVADLGNRASHDIVVKGLTILKRLMHRGATGNDPETGDGAGLLLKIPHGFFRERLEKGFSRKERNEHRADEMFGVAMIFGGEGEEAAIEDSVRSNSCEVMGWRDVPINPDAIGKAAKAILPRIRQLFISQSVTDGPSFERRLYIIRRQIEKQTKSTYICSCSSRTIVYKGLLLATQIEKFYPDLSDPDFVSPFAIVHQRYSTNTFPSWELAHPFRMLAHNGEINTLKGNLNALAARESALASPLFGDELKKLLPLIRPGQSDSASLDNMFELLVAAGREPAHAMLMLMPQAWGAKYHMGHDVRGFCEYHSALMEPWDGPAAVAFTDGITAGAALDRNGLRPARWTLTSDNLFVLASETGVLDIPPEKVVRHGRLRPGAMVYLDLPNHRLLEDAEIKNRYARRRPYRRWVAENRIDIQGLFTEIVPSKIADTLVRDQERFGYTAEDIDLILKPMAATGHEPVGSMGNDAALPVLSRKRRLLFDYFHQLFAQVTNPPIDPIREELVMSLMTYIGNVGNILDETPGHARLIKLRRPVLTDDELSRLSKVADRGYPAATLPLFFADDLKAALDRLAAAALQAVKDGTKILVLSDRYCFAAANEKTEQSAPCASCGEKRIPSLLAVAAVNKALTEAGVRPSIGLIVQSGEVREVHHFAVLLGYGATAINPYLALETVSALHPHDSVAAASNYIAAVDKGLLKIMSKMGISTLRSYRSAQIFEAVGLGPKLMHDYFGGGTSPVDGIELEALEKLLCLPAPSCGTLDPGGLYRYRKEGEDHLWTPETVAAFRQAVRANDAAKFREYTVAINDLAKHRVTLRSLFAFRPTQAIPVDEVEPIESIMRHFVGGAMSLGSLSPEAHETIAQAFNAIGSMSNCGEGGENAERFGTDRNCGIKQVASGRFGVTVSYLRNAKDIQIKLAQGAKPGEGGQLPAHKVNAFVGRLRHAKPGTTLISPPPHHDIYSIEDLAQLIYDLRSANPEARISVKLVSEAGVGTIAAGVAKAHADVVLVSGYDGGTGAAPLTSMKHAGLPWELGLAETQQTLVKNGLRGRVKVQVDGQLKTGRDIVIGALLGAEEFGFGTTLLVALGCVQDRRCHCNTCPVGIATQEECLRRKFAGKKEHIINFLRFIAEDVRGQLAALGLRSLDEAVGRADLLDTAAAAARCGLDFSALFAREKGEDAKSDPAYVKEALNHYDERELLPAVQASGILGAKAGAGTLAESLALDRTIANVNRTVGTRLSGEIAARYGVAGLPDGSVTVNFTGVAGQSFGAFLAPGVTFNLRGEANDFVGKGLSGGIITIAPPAQLAAVAERNVIAGNVIAYGGTSGAVFVNGLAGERFGIRNSGVTLVAEGVGDHGCEYMTGGVAVILGPTGVNFGAGMTGGVAYVLDEAGDFDLRCNLDSIDLETIVTDSASETELKSLLEEHVRRTGSPKAQRLLGNWREALAHFVKVVPVQDWKTSAH